MIEKTISTRRKCYKGHLVVKRIQFIDNQATTYYYYCEKCNKRYTKIDLIGGPSESKYTKESKKKSKEINVVVAINENVAKKKMIHKEKDGLPRIIVVPAGTKMPKKCLKCNAELNNFSYYIGGKKKKKKQLIGKQCLACEAIFYPQATYMQHEEMFILANNENVPEDDTYMQDDCKNIFLNNQIIEVKEKEPKNKTIVEEILSDSIYNDENRSKEKILEDVNKESKITHNDDFGNIFDFSELKHILNL